MGEVVSVQEEGNNKTFIVRSSIGNELKVDQSVAHDGVCLTVTGINGNEHTVTAIDETLSRTNLNYWTRGDKINLERCLVIGGRLDGHWVQGHVDCTGECVKVETKNGSYVYTFKYADPQYRTIPKGSITINGTSLTVVESEIGRFSVAIIPYTFENTTIQYVKAGSIVNLEFDVVGKWIKEWIKP